MIIYTKNNVGLYHVDANGCQTLFFIGDLVKSHKDGTLYHVRGICSNYQMWMGDDVFLSTLEVVKVED